MIDLLMARSRVRNILKLLHEERKIILEEPIKSLGIYSVPVKLHAEVEATVKVWVVKE